MTDTAPGVGHVELRQVVKRFGATTALAGVDLQISRGSVHALVGENGAGKSTLARVIAGVHAPDSGAMWISGRQVALRSPRQAGEHGITMIAQELSLVPRASVLTNVYLGIEDHWGPAVRRRSLRRRYDQLVDSSGIRVPPERLVADLTVGDQQKVEILRALARNAQLVVMDEPTARLSTYEARALHATIRQLAASGTSVLFVSHFIDEVLALADRITVMRDGRVVSTRSAAELDHESIIEQMTGARTGLAFPTKRRAPDEAPETLRVSGLSRRGNFHDVSFSVRAGEIVVLAGLVGAGRSEVMRAVYGADSVNGGQVLLGGLRYSRRSPRRSLDRGVVVVPESRKSQGLVPGRSVLDNVTLPWLPELSRFGIVSRRREQRAALPRLADADVRTASTSTPVAALSGGNQQKVLFARSMLHRPTLLIADEPTRGVDVGAKRKIYELIVEAAERGAAVVVVSSEIEEVVGLAHRIIVMRAGSIVAEFDGDADEQAVIAAAFTPEPSTGALEGWANGTD